MCMYACMHVRLYVHMYIRTHAWMYVCMYVCTYVCIHVHNLTTQVYYYSDVCKLTLASTTLTSGLKTIHTINASQV